PTVPSATVPQNTVFTDASGDIGFGAFFNGKWFSLPWPRDFKITARSPRDSMALRELFPLILASYVWGPYFRSSFVIFMCDNMSAVEILNRGRSKIVVLNNLLKS